MKQTNKQTHRGVTLEEQTTGHRMPSTNFCWRFSTTKRFTHTHSRMHTHILNHARMHAHTHTHSRMHTHILTHSRTHAHTQEDKLAVEVKKITKILLSVFNFFSRLLIFLVTWLKICFTRAKYYHPIFFPDYYYSLLALSPANRDLRTTSVPGTQYKTCTIYKRKTYNL